jgi:GNAT superfamily N-acetyltransferase
MPGDLLIQPASTRADVEAFIRFPFKLYEGATHWCPPLLMERRDFLDPRKNPVYEYAKIQLFLARRGGEVVGTIAAINNSRYGEFHPEDKHVGFFGLFECVQDQAVADALFAAAGAWLKGEGRGVMRGPVNFTTNDVVGLLVDGFDDDPSIMMSYNYAYYDGLFAAAGFTKAKDVHAFELSGEVYDGKLDALAARLAKRGSVQVRPIDLKRWKEELEFVRYCYNLAWAKNWGFVPWTDRELEFIAKELKPLADPRLAFVAEVDGKPAGIMITIPDANQALKLAKGRLFPFGLFKILWKLKVKKVTRLRTMALGVLPEHRRLGIAAILIQRLTVNARAMGFKGSELSWILEDNEGLLGPLRQIGAWRTKTYRVYDRSI